MNIKKIRKIVVVVVALLTISGAGFVAADKGGNPNANAFKNNKHTSVPEIDAGAGGYALAFLAGMILLVSERTRRRSQ
jgi:hypothetical protein